MKKTILDKAIALGKEGFYVFPCLEDGKTPAVDEWQRKATRNPKRITMLWTEVLSGEILNYNIGISTSKFGENEALIVIDVDDKDGRCGSDDLLEMELLGNEFTKTKTTTTATGGRHLIYRVRRNSGIGNRSKFPANGLDVRGTGGLAIAAGSVIDGKTYRSNKSDIAECPKWLYNLLVSGSSSDTDDRRDKETTEVNQDAAKARAVHYLENEAPLAMEGDGGDHTTFAVCCRLRDIGLTEENCLLVLWEEWNSRCEPPWDHDELEKKVKNAYAYSRNKKIGKDAPENFFSDETESGDGDTEPLAKSDIDKELGNNDPVLALNKKHAFVIAGENACVLWEMKDAKGRSKIKYLNLFSFEKLYMNKLVNISTDPEKPEYKPLSNMWLRSKHRRSYDDICFAPGREVGKRYYNLWHGLCVNTPKADEKISQRGHNSVERFKEHALENVCKGDKPLYNWLMGYFAHMVQRPGHKPLTALVFKGRKGTGKNALIARIGAIFRDYYILASNRKLLVGQFNAHLENLILLVLDEAFWSGDKEGEGVLKDLVTGDTHNIEHKGKAIYQVDNLVRIVIIGNEEWLVPASDDERRYAVFELGEGRMQDDKYFEEMRIGMQEHGGDQLLLQYLLGFDISKVNVNVVPKTEGLLNQKIETLKPVQAFWLQCLTDGEIPGVSFDDDIDWPKTVDKYQMKAASLRYSKDRNVRSFVADDRTLGRALKRCCPGIDISRKRVNKERRRVYAIPPLAEARKQFEKFIGHDMEWPDDTVETEGET